MSAPATGPVSFSHDIRPLFRDFDITSMKTQPPPAKRFDLSKYEDVRDRADKILKVLQDQTMPCDDPWPDDKVALFQKWISDGKNP
jgi:hypothetical protein